MHETRRTGVRFVLTNPSDPGRLDDFSNWYDTYAAALTVPGKPGCRLGIPQTRTRSFQADGAGMSNPPRRSLPTEYFPSTRSRTPSPTSSRAAPTAKSSSRWCDHRPVPIAQEGSP